MAVKSTELETLVLNARHQQLTGTADQWYFKNPILMSGEFGIETDTYKIKAGDGITPWRDLPYSNFESITNIEISYEDFNNNTMLSGGTIARLPKGFFLSVAYVHIEEAWQATMRNTEDFEFSIGTGDDRTLICDSQNIDLSATGTTFVYPVNQKIETPTALCLYLNKTGELTSGKLLINLK